MSVHTLYSRLAKNSVELQQVDIDWFLSHCDLLFMVLNIYLPGDEEGGATPGGHGPVA